MKKIAAGVDIGGTHITVGLVDLTNKTLITDSLERRHIDASAGEKEVIRSWAEAIRAAHEKASIEIGRLGFAMPGPFDYAKGISWITGLHKYENLYGKPVGALLATELGIAPDRLRFVNDAAAFLFGEMHAGAGKGFANMVGITLGTGLGSASFYDERLEEGDLYCTPFNDGQCEDYLSARWLIEAYRIRSGVALKGVKELAVCAQTEQDAREIFEEFGRNLAVVLHRRYAKQSPELVIVGGNIANAWELFIPTCLLHLKQSGASYVLRRAVLGETAALIGASCLWL